MKKKSFEAIPADNPDLKELEEKIGYKFSRSDFLRQALSHRSYAYEKGEKDNERLEFLGDAILQFVISEYLTLNYSDLTEGELSKFRSVIVSENGLSPLAEKLQLGRYLLIGKGEELTGGRKKKSILSNTIEALLAAVFLDSRERHGIDKVTEVIHNLFIDEIKEAETTFLNFDYKTDCQEYVQKQKLGLLKYKIIQESGPDHNKRFVSALLISDKVYGVGRGKSKKMAEQEAAVNALKKIKNPL